MKFWRISFALVVLLSIIATYSYAHPGRTDGSGGHINHSTGEYHYHHGYSEHQHYDMDGDGVDDCPRNFKTNTSDKNKDSSSNKNSYSFADEYNSARENQSKVSVKDNNPEKASKKTSSLSSKDKAIGVAFVLSIACVIFYEIKK
jgi:hypothetical protein